jgi:hypothetical protein
MAQYLLLRNNKESGPYSLDDLVGLGLKPYDLVWVKGKSAAWRYPSEVAELKSFAPVIEEQPFDRFFKKHTEEKQEETPKQEQMAIVAPEHEKYIPKKSVYVNMPGQKTNPTPQPIKETLPTTPVQPTIAVSENPVTTEIKYSQPLDEIKEMYVKTLHDRKQRIARKGFWLQNLKKAAVLFLLVAVGVMVGFMLKSNKDKVEASVSKVSAPSTVQSIPPASDKDTSAEVQHNDRKVIAPPTGGFVNKEVLQSKKPVEEKESFDKMARANLKKEPVLGPSENETKNSFVAKGVTIDPVTGERDHRVRNATDAPGNSTTKSTERSASTNELSNQVIVTSNDYKKVAFGGIRDLQLTVTNDSKFVLDNVTVELQYLKPSEQTLRTENIQFTSIGPKSASTVRVPDTNRGIKVIYRIISIKKHPADGDVAGF